MYLKQYTKHYLVNRQKVKMECQNIILDGYVRDFRKLTMEGTGNIPTRKNQYTKVNPYVRFLSIYLMLSERKPYVPSAGSNALAKI